MGPGCSKPERLRLIHRVDWQPVGLRKPGVLQEPVVARDTPATRRIHDGHQVLMWPSSRARIAGSPGVVVHARLEDQRWVQLYHVLIDDADVVVVSRSGEDHMDLMTRAATLLAHTLVQRAGGVLVPAPYVCRPSNSSGSWLPAVAAWPGPWPHPGPLHDQRLSL